MLDNEMCRDLFFYLTKNGFCDKNTDTFNNWSSHYCGDISPGQMSMAVSMIRLMKQAGEGGFLMGNCASLMYSGQEGGE